MSRRFFALLGALCVLLGGCSAGYRARIEADRFGLSGNYDARTQAGGAQMTWEHVYRNPARVDREGYAK